jgi:CO/xanthine dehydrogenase FAD-binding subunit
MGRVIAYHRPDSVAAAIELLSDPRRRALAGGTVVVAEPPADDVEVVDLQDLGLRGIAFDGSRARLLAATTLQDLVDEPELPLFLREIARAEAPSTLRTMATLGGTVAAAGSNSRLLAALLVSESFATVVTRHGTASHSVAQILGDPALLRGALITDVTVAVDGRGAHASTGRTPADVPIVAAVGRRNGLGHVHVAITGVAATPVLVDDPARVHPVGDFRGSAEYRSYLASVLSTRVRNQLSS